MVPRLGTTNDGGGMMAPVEVKIIVGGPHTRCGWEGNAGSVNTDACFDTMCPRAAVGRSAASQFLEGSLEGAVTHSSL